MSSTREYDIIFAGAGTAACVAAGRLAAADPKLKILLLEAGPHTLGLAAHVEPYRFVTHLAPESATVTPFASAPSAAVGGRSIIVPAGHCVGGGSSVNFAMYTRAAASDYDDWGASGWTADDLLPLLRKMETYQEEPNQPTHGYNGPLKVSYGGHFLGVAREFLNVAAVYDKERGLSHDMNALYECDGYARWAKWIDKESGRRSDPAHHYVYSQAPSTNMEIHAGARVVRVLFEGDRASGVEYVTEGKANTTVTTVRASRMVVLAAGAFGSPAILERSGIGCARRLEKLGVPLKVDLPGVGEKYQDHNLLYILYHAPDDTETLGNVLQGPPEEIAYWQKVYDQERRGLMAHNGMDAGIKIRPSAAERSAMGPAMAAHWEKVFEHAPDKPLLLFACAATALLRDDPALQPHSKVFGVVYYTGYPQSRGRTHITSAQDAHAPPAFESGYLEDNGADLASLVWGYKRTRELARRMPAYRGELASTHPVFTGGARNAEGDEAKTVRTTAAHADCSPVAGPAPGPVPIDAPDITYSAEDDKAIEEWTRQFVQTAWHSLGTCAMKARTDGGVVDARLNVYGVCGLKVADLSIPPSNVGANTCSTALLIGEKAALLIAEDLGIQGV
ncbi:alcohol oxidase-like protein [Schizophyllum fasciatum]